MQLIPVKHTLKLLFFILWPFLTLASPMTPTSVVSEYRLASFQEKDYQKAVTTLVSAWQKATGQSLRSDRKSKVGIKIYTQSGVGLATPPHLVRAVISFLLKQGWTKKQLFLLDLNARSLRAAGFLPPLSDPHTALFEEVPVYILESERYFDPKWYYDSPLPSPRFPNSANTHTDEARKSFLPAALLSEETAFWINLPIATNLPSLGISGALANATLWNISNYQRFLNSASHAPAAVAQIAAMLKPKWIFTLITLEHYQYIGGPKFNALYTHSEPLLWLSADPLALDAFLHERLNQARAKGGFPLLPSNPALFEYGKKGGLGDPDDKTLQPL